MFGCWWMQTAFDGLCCVIFQRENPFDWMGEWARVELVQPNSNASLWPQQNTEYEAVDCEHFDSECWILFKKSTHQIKCRLDQAW